MKYELLNLRKRLKAMEDKVQIVLLLRTTIIEW